MLFIIRNECLLSHKKQGWIYVHVCYIHAIYVFIFEVLAIKAWIFTSKYILKPFLFCIHILQQNLAVNHANLKLAILLLYPSIVLRL